MFPGYRNDTVAGPRQHEVIRCVCNSTKPGTSHKHRPQRESPETAHVVLSLQMELNNGKLVSGRSIIFEYITFDTRR